MEQPSIPTASFRCSGCGGQMTFDTAEQAMKCVYCGKIDAIEHDRSVPEEYELDSSEEANARDWGSEKKVIHCNSCGADTVFDTFQTAASCTFCGSSQIVEQGDDAGIHPKSLIPFAISKEQALEAFRAWKKRRFFAPSNFKKMKLEHQLSGVYLPFWTYDADTYSSYTAQKGTHYYRPVTRTRVVDGKTETYTEQVRETRWESVRGNHAQYFNDSLIHASKKVPSMLIHKLGGFQLNELVGYKPEYLSGFLAERYSIDVQSGWDLARAGMNGELRAQITSRIGGDEVRHLQVYTNYADVKYKHILLPVWNSSYPFKGKIYSYIVNGQNGRVEGQAPVSPIKVTMTVAAALIIVLLVILAVNGS